MSRRWWYNSPRTENWTLKGDLMGNQLRLGLTQMRCGDDPAENLDRAVDKIRAVAAQGAQVICLQELFRSRYFCQSEDVKQFDLAEPIPGPSSHRLAEVTADLGVTLIASLFERRTAGIYHNTAIILNSDGSLGGIYRKMHIPDDPYYYEKFYFTPGDLGFRSHHTEHGELGVLVCWDQWFPEAARLTALSGAQILFYPTAIGWLEGEDMAVNHAQRSAWETVQRGHAVANGVFVAAVNRVGREGQLNFWGSSFVADPFGRILAQASEDKEENLLVECDLSQIEETRRNWPFLRDRRIEAYQDLSVRFLDPETPGSTR